MAHYPMEISDTGTERFVHFEGAEGSGFVAFNEVIPDLPDTIAEAQFLRVCDKKVAAACGDAACNELVGFTRAKKSPDNSPLDETPPQSIIGVYVACDMFECSLYKKRADVEQSIPVPAVTKRDRFLPASLR